MTKNKKVLGIAVNECTSIGSSFSRYKLAASLWKRERDASIPIVEKALDLRNQATYVTNTQLSGMVGTSVRASRLQANVETEMMGRLQQLNACQQAMIQSLHTMDASIVEQIDIVDAGAEDEEDREGGTAHSLDDEAGKGNNNNGVDDDNNNNNDEVLAANKASAPCMWPLDMSQAKDMLDQLRQQTLLEASIYEMLVQETQEGESLGHNGGGGSAGGHDTAVTCLACFTYPPYLNESVLHIILQLSE